MSLNYTTVIGCFTYQSYVFLGSAWPMKALMESRLSAVNLKVWLCRIAVVRQKDVFKQTCYALKDSYTLFTLSRESIHFDLMNCNVLGRFFFAQTETVVL